MPRISSFFKRTIDIFVTLACWLYFTIGFIILFAPFYIYSTLFRFNEEYQYQRLNHYFYRIFFSLLNFLIPNFTVMHKSNVENITSSVIVSNHVSYLDPLLLISTFSIHKTIVKDKFFKIPIFGAVLKRSGYIPSSSHGKLAYLTIRQMDNLKSFFDKGGNLFIFPEGTRSRKSLNSNFYNSAFKIAKRYNVPIKVVYIKNTNILFPPGKFMFNTMLVDSISIELLGTVQPDLEGYNSSISDLVEKTQRILAKAK